MEKFYQNKKNVELLLTTEKPSIKDINCKFLSLDYSLCSPELVQF